MVFIACVALSLFLIRGCYRFNNRVRLIEAGHHSQFWKHVAEDNALSEKKSAQDAEEAVAMAKWETEQARIASSQSSRQNHLHEAERWTKLADLSKESAAEWHVAAEEARSHQSDVEKRLRDMEMRLRAEW
jgi:hypothetical protein